MIVSEFIKLLQNYDHNEPVVFEIRNKSVVADDTDDTAYVDVSVRQESGVVYITIDPTNYLMR